MFHERNIIINFHMYHIKVVGNGWFKISKNCHIQWKIQNWEKPMPVFGNKIFQNFLHILFCRIRLIILCLCRLVNHYFKNKNKLRIKIRKNSKKVEKSWQWSIYFLDGLGYHKKVCGIGKKVKAEQCFIYRISNLKDAGGKKCIH